MTTLFIMLGAGACGLMAIALGEIAGDKFASGDRSAASISRWLGVIFMAIAIGLGGAA